MAIDLICALVAMYGFWQGYNRGIVSTVFNVLTYVFGLVIALKVTPLTTQLLEDLFKSDNPLMFIAGFLVNIFLVVFILKQAAKGLENVLQAVHMGLINQVLGGGISAILAVLIFSVLVWFGVKSHILNDALLADSRTYKPLLEPMPPRAKDIAMRLKPLAEEGWTTFSVWLDRLDSYKKENGVEPNAKPPNSTSERKIFDLPESKDDGIERTTRE
jgi:membrane protein required for colicin V production